MSKINYLLITVGIIILLGIGYFGFLKYQASKIENVYENKSVNVVGAGNADGSLYTQNNLSKTLETSETEVDKLKANGTTIGALKVNAIALQTKISLTMYQKPADKKQYTTDLYNQIQFGYKKIDNLEKSSGKNLQAVRARYMYLLDYLTDNASLSSFQNSIWARTEDYKIFQTKSNNPQIVYFMFLDDAYSRYSIPNDSLVISIRMNNLSRILQNFADQLTPDQKKYYLQQQLDLKGQYEKADKSTLFTSVQYTEVKPLFNYLNGIISLSLVNNGASTTLVQSTFQKLYALIDQNTKSEVDVMNSIKFNAYIAELVYDYRFNNQKITDDMLPIIEKMSAFNTSINSGIKDLLNNRFLGYNLTTDWRMSSRMMIAMAKKNPKLMQILTDNGYANK